MKTNSLKRRLAVLAAVAVLPLGALAACSSSDDTDSNETDTNSDSSAAAAGLESGLGSRSENRKVYFLTYYDPTADAFWNQMLTGAEDAAALAGLELEHQTSDGADVGKMTDLVSTAAATNPAAIFVPFNDPSWEGAACAAADAGIPIFAFNVPPTEESAGCVQAFVGQDFFAVGEIIGNRLLEEVDLKSGDKVLCPAEEPDQQYAIQRGGGVNEALKAVGIECETLRTTGEDAGALDALTAWLTANPDVKAITPLGGTPHRNLVAAEDAAGVEAPIVGFDTSPQVIDGIKSGRIIATADQQGYIQGFQTVMQAGLYLDFGLSPANINSGGNALIDETNVENLEAEDLAGVRY